MGLEVINNEFHESFDQGPNTTASIEASISEKSHKYVFQFEDVGIKCIHTFIVNDGKFVFISKRSSDIPINSETEEEIVFISGENPSITRTFNSIHSSGRPVQYIQYPRWFDQG